MARGLESAGSVVVAHGLSCSVACGIFRTRAQTRVPCIGRRVLNHWATREAPSLTFSASFGIGCTTLLLEIVSLFSFCDTSGSQFTCNFSDSFAGYFSSAWSLNAGVHQGLHLVFHWLAYMVYLGGNIYS